MKLFLVILFLSLYNVRGDFKSELLDAHNKYRQGILDGKEPLQPKALKMPMLTWNEDLAKNAQKLADKCKLEHNTYEDRKVSGFNMVGQNLFMGLKTATNAEAVDAWYEEIKDYDYDTQKCSGSACGHYTQVVWAGTTQVGCGRSTNCADGSVIIACDYAAAGNYAGLKPYEKDPDATRPPKTTTPLPTPGPPRSIKDTLMVWANEGKTEPSAFQQGMLEAHNTLRRKTLDGDESRQPRAESMPMLEWHPTLATNAQAHVEACVFNYALPDTRLIANYTYVNRNIFVRQESLPYYQVTTKEVMDEWYGQIDQYNFENNKCFGFCDHYTQIVAAKTTRVGCGRAVCNGKVFIACDYAEGECQCTKKQPYVPVPRDPPTKMETEMLEAHNNYRKGIYMGIDKRQPYAMWMSALKWNTKLAKYAQAQADSCLKESDSKQRKADIWEYENIGFNLYEASNLRPDNKDAVDSWYGQIVNYDYERARCNIRNGCDGYLQVVNARTTMVGCGRSQCKFSKFLIICYYGEGYVGYLPYAKGPPTTTLAPTTITFNPDVYSKQMLGLINDYRTVILNGTERRQPKAAEMPMLEWDSDLAANAQKISAKCKSVITTEEEKQTSRFKNVAEIYNNVPSSDLSVALRGWLGGASWYIYDSNRCEMGEGMCEPFRQIVYDKGTHVGCATTNCADSFRTVCLFGQRISSLERPYTSAVPFVPEQSYIDDLVKYHNILRNRLASSEAKVPQAKSMPKLNWNTDLATTAKLMANLCDFSPSQPIQRQSKMFKNIGENMYREDSSTFSTAKAVNSWYGKMSNYDYTKNACRDGNTSCYPFLQLAWAKATEFGCGSAKCRFDTIIYCHYNEGVVAGESPYESK